MLQIHEQMHTVRMRQFWLNFEIMDSFDSQLTVTFSRIIGAIEVEVNFGKVRLFNISIAFVSYVFVIVCNCQLSSYLIFNIFLFMREIYTKSFMATNSQFEFLKITKKNVYLMFQVNILRFCNTNTIVANFATMSLAA